MRRKSTLLTIGVMLIGVMNIPVPAVALYIPDAMYLIRPYEDNASTTNVSAGPIASIPDPFVIEETDIFAGAVTFPRNEFVARFVTTGETTGQQAFGHKFQRSEAWDVAFDLKIETPNSAPRKEAGMYFETPIGNEIIYVATSADQFEEGPGDITAGVYDRIPRYIYNLNSDLRGDYNHNNTVDAADYVIWRQTLGSTTDFRANGNNEGDSENLIDQADYETWLDHYGRTKGVCNGTCYTVGDTLRFRTIYTPPEIDPDIPFNLADPGANVVTPATMEYQVSLNGGPVQSSGPLDFTSDWLGIPDNTRIAARVQNVASAATPGDSSKVTFSNWDFNGDLPGSGLGSGFGAASLAPEPATVLLVAIGALMLVNRRDLKRAV